MPPTVAEIVHEQLRVLTSLSEARRLFSELNFGPENAPLSRTGWPEHVRTALAEDPRVIARHGDFQIIYSRFASPRLVRTTEREVVAQLLRGRPYALFLFSDDDGSDWHFVNATFDDDETRRRVFRRFTVGPDERRANRLRTVSEQLARAALPDEELDRLESSPLAVQQRFDQAFDVEVVTKEFYREYRRVFELVEASIKGFGPDRERKRLFTQRLFNRLLFLGFIQKKGWLRLSEQAGSDYLSALWRAYVEARVVGTASSFYEDRLKLLFFAGLNTSSGEDIASVNQGGFLRELIGRIPYLNGGLFDQEEDDLRQDIEVPDPSLHMILSDLFDRFNFTITESTSLDIEVAVDPEMLGKVFEELVTGRHESGSYYTPKPIVSFMCREALKGYLEAALPHEVKESLHRFVDDYEPTGLRDPEAVLGALRVVRVCDPACGSGAYLLGLLHELLELRQSLFSVRNVDPISSYNRKLEIIQRNLYGVDIDQFAVNIARLRLWLSLAVEFEGDNPPPLPNLDFKIEQGDSVLGPEPQVGIQDTARGALIREYVQLKSDYMTAHSGMKRRLQAEIEAKQRQISLWTQGVGITEGFDWAVEFAEVFAKGGFDIVLANPPYVRQELIGEIKPSLKRAYGDLYSGTADLYVYFYYRALQLLRPAGMLVFISSNKWFRANYGKKLRAHMSEVASVCSITDFRDLPVFESATAYPMIFIASKGRDCGPTRYTEVPSLEAPYPDVQAVVDEHGQFLPDSAVSGENWTLADASVSTDLQIMARAGCTLGEYVNGKIYYGVKTGLNKAFVINGRKRAELIEADPTSAEIIRPLVVGRDIGKWVVDYKDRWLIFAKRGIRIENYPAVLAHLEQWRNELTPKHDRQEKVGRKPGKYKWYEVQDAVDYFRLFHEPKIVFPDISREPRFALDSSGAYLINTVYFIPNDDLFLLGVLNSRSLLTLYLQINSQIRGGYLRFFDQYIEKLPIPTATSVDRRRVADLVNECLRIGVASPDRAAQEEEINARVARLYGLSREDQ